VEEMPVFGDCVALPLSERRQCSDAALLSYIYKHIRYPGAARENGIEGTVYVQFVVEKDGSASQVKILRDIGGGCGREVERVVAEMPKWSVPGKQRGRPVRVQFNLPVKFKLQ
jgi:protein TonB